MKKKLDLFNVLAVLVNGGYLLQKRPILFGPCQYFVYFPDKHGDVVLGYVTESVVCNLWDSGLIIGKDCLKQDDDFIKNTFVLKNSTLSELFESLKIKKSMEV